MRARAKCGCPRTGENSIKAWRTLEPPAAISDSGSSAVMSAPRAVQCDAIEKGYSTRGRDVCTESAHGWCVCVRAHVRLKYGYSTWGHLHAAWRLGGLVRCY